MRAVWIVLVGAGLTVGAAVADPVHECRLDDLELTTEMPGSP